jgi:hypothetical protein
MMTFSMLVLSRLALKLRGDINPPFRKQGEYARFDGFVQPCHHRGGEGTRRPVGRGVPSAPGQRIDHGLISTHGPEFPSSIVFVIAAAKGLAALPAGFMGERRRFHYRSSAR